MGFFSKFESKVEDTFEGAADKMIDAPISPVQIAKKAEKQMRREKMVGAGKQYAPTLYTVLVNPDDDERLFGYYPTLAGEIETFLSAKAADQGLVMDGQPLVRFIVDDGLRHGKFDVIAEPVAAPIVSQLRAEEMQRYGIAQRAGQPYNGYAPAPAPTPSPAPAAPAGYGQNAAALERADYAPAAHDPYAPQAQLPYVPEEEIDRSIDYGEYTFNSKDFESYQQQAAGNAAAAASTVMLGQPVQGGQGAHLIDTTNNRTYRLTGHNQIAGRSETCDIVVPDINTSRRHAQIGVNAQGYWTISDLGSKNGTVVNGQIVPNAVLNEGDRITLGLTNFIFTQA
ncbi:MAG: DUF3662 and FHA domain-containing protein [Eggerthellales bacterium]|nr:DUF3662 and FHA domain-containing protein [Eggerthellales bacterium]